MRHPFRSTRLAVVAPLLVVAAAGCQKQSLAAAARSDSLQTALSEQQLLGNQLQLQKDSLVRVVLEADAFLGRMDSAMKTVRGLPAASRENTEGPIADQMAARRNMLRRVNALVARAKSTASQLAALQKQDSALQSENAEMRAAAEAQAAKISADAQMVADLGTTIEGQRQRIAMLESSLDSLNRAYAMLDTANNKVYYIVGTERDLIAKGIIVKEGGANLLIARPGKTIVPSRTMDTTAFTPIDQRNVHIITVPDSTKRYRIVSRQDLNSAEVADRRGTAFTGNLNITKPEEFWSRSRYLILIEL